MKRTFQGALAAAAIALATSQPAHAQFFPGECAVSGGGQIVSPSGDRATFGGTADSERLLAHEVYVDHGPATELRFRSLTMNAMICNLDARTVEFTGQGVATTALGVEQPVQYRIEMIARRFSDAYRITLSNGYDSGLQPVLHGNIILREG
jgi:hypothetical protein